MPLATQYYAIQICVKTKGTQGKRQALRQWGQEDIEMIYRTSDNFSNPLSKVFFGRPKLSVSSARPHLVELLFPNIVVKTVPAMLA